MFLELPISGLHRLFHTVPSSSHPLPEKSPLESFTEETHTYDLLYPDHTTLFNAHHNIYPLGLLDPTSVASAATSFDDRGDLDIQSSHDVRVIVAQDGNAVAQQPRILYDSNPPASPRPPSGAGSKTRSTKDNLHTGHAVRGESGNRPENNGRILQTAHDPKPLAGPQSSPSSPESGTGGAFWTSQARRTGLRSSVNEEESIQSRNAKEGREETDALLGCMFGQTGLPLVSSTKLHINPPKVSQYTSGLVDSPDLSGSRPFPKKRTPLTRSMTAEDLQNTPVTSTESAITRQLQSNVKGPSILVTRLFSVELDALVVAKAANAADPSRTPQEAPSASSDDKAKQIKVPKYGVAILIQLPPIKKLNMALAPNHRSRLGSSHEEPHQLSAIRERLNHESLLVGHSEPTVVDQDIERIIAHWSALTRVVSLLEAVASSAIRNKLHDTCMHELDGSSAMTNNHRPSAKDDARLKKRKQPSQRTVQLPSQILHDSVMAKSASDASQRIVSALKTPRVVTGQCRWGIWREEARWVSRWAGGKEQNFFLFNLLTAFLGNHTDWLETLGLPGSGQSRAEKMQRETDTIKHRTIIVSSDKMSARRLIFLLSTFLPCSYVTPQGELPGRPMSSRSSTGLSRSPPAGIPIPRERSLRRTINRKPRESRDESPYPLHERSISFQIRDGPTSQSTSGAAGQRPLGHNRRTSDTRSIRSLALPIPTSQANTRKSSITTVSTIVPDSTAVPHFATPPPATGGTAAAPRPGSSGSLASLSLRRTLSRSESTADSMSPDSPSASRWGSMLSGFWSTRRGSSTDHTDPMGSPRDGLGISGVPYSSSPGKLAQMVQDLNTQPIQVFTDPDRETLHNPPSPGTNTEETLQAQVNGTAARDIPERPKEEEFPMKFSIDTNDGVVDIDLPANSCSSSFDSSVSSPRAPKSAASSFNDHSSTYGRTSTHSQPSIPSTSPPTVDVAGYLKSYHQDYALQAVRPYKELKEEIKISMHNEALIDRASPAGTDDVCTTLIADTSTFSITRLSLRHGTSNGPTSSSNLSVEPQVTEEPLMDLDPTLICAGERVIAHSEPSSVNHSRAPSPSRQHPSTDHHDEVGRGECRTLILGALEKVARSVAAEQKGGGEEADSTLREGVRRWLDEVGRRRGV